MDDKEPSVEIVAEPSVDQRFGVSPDRKIKPSTALKLGVAVTIIALTTVLLIRTPEKPMEEHAGVKPPETSQVGQSDQMQFDPYSAAKENEQIKEQTKKRVVHVVIRLPGLQKIDRKSDIQIPPGSTVKAVLLTGASNGAVRAQIKESLQIQGETLVPEGATLLGQGQSTDDRLLVHFTQIIFKDGTFEATSAQAADAEDKIVGLHGSKIGSFAMKYAAAIGLNFVGGMSEGLQDHQAVGQQVVTTPNAKNALLNGTSKATLQLANDTMSDIKSKPPVIEVPAGKEIMVVFEGGK